MNSNDKGMLGTGVFFILGMAVVMCLVATSAHPNPLSGTGLQPKTSGEMATTSIVLGVASGDNSFVGWEQ